MIIYLYMKLFDYGYEKIYICNYSFHNIPREYLC